MVTASHNPPDYNGYKVYWENGAQIISPIDEGIALAIDKAAKSEILWRDVDAAVRDGMVRMLGKETVEAYLEAVRGLSAHPATAKRGDIVIAYTPMHGVGAGVTEAALARAGFTKVHTVKEQREPDGNFPTVKFPNPEEPGAMDLALALATKVKADLVMANDPDADRLAVGLPHPNGGYRMLTGDQVGVLLGDDLIAAQPKNAVVGCSIVSSRMLGLIARARGAGYFETLTGFKWIANRAMELKAERDLRLIFGYEEALGYTVGELVRDKDGVSAAVAMAELWAGLRAERKTLLDQLDAIARRFGLWVSGQIAATLPGKEGLDRIRAIMRSLRDDPPAPIGPFAVVERSDALVGKRWGKDGEGVLPLPPSDVLFFQLDGGSRIVARPSGTEPKIKIYLDVVEKVADGEATAAAEARAHAKLAALRAAMVGRAGLG
jgi:phosphomannomutase